MKFSANFEMSHFMRGVSFGAVYTLLYLLTQKFAMDFSVPKANPRYFKVYGEGIGENARSIGGSRGYVVYELPMEVLASEKMQLAQILIDK